MSSGDSTEAVVNAFVSALKANPDVAALVADRVYGDMPPVGAQMPMIVVGDVTRAPWDDDDCNGSELTLELRVFENGGKSRPIGYRLAGGLSKVLDMEESAIVVPGHDVAGIFVLEVRTTRDEVRSTGVVRVRVLTSAAP